MFNKEYIEFLKQEIEWLKGQVEREKKRADLAVDALLALKANSPPITPEKFDFNNENNLSNKTIEVIKNEIEMVGKELENNKLYKEEYK